MVRLTPLEAGFWKRVDGSLDLGFSFTEADDRTQFSFGAEAEYRTRKYLRSLSLSSVVVSQPQREIVDDEVDEVSETNRSDLSLFVTRYLRWPKRHFLGFATLQQNEELGIDLRTLAGAAAGWDVVQSNTEVLALAAGMAVTREQLAGSDPSQENLEAFLGLQFQSFKFDTPHQRDVDLTLAVFPSLSDSGRVRAELNARVCWEIVKDFFFGLSLLESYDSEPPTDAVKSDLTLTTSLGWSF